MYNFPPSQAANMTSNSTMEKKPAVLDTSDSVVCSDEAEGSIIYIDPEKEAAVRRKFDKYVVPVSVIFLVLSTLDRNNVSEAVRHIPPSLTLFSSGMLASSASTKTLDSRAGNLATSTRYQASVPSSLSSLGSWPFDAGVLRKPSVLHSPCGALALLGLPSSKHTVRLSLFA